MQFESISDDILVEKVGGGDRQAASVLVRRHSQRVLNIARRMMVNEAEAEDVTQDVFLKVWKSAAKWESGKAKFTTWLHRVTVNTCLDRLRKPKMGNVDTVPEVADESETPAQRLEAESRSELLKRAMEQLPDRQRAALSLCYFEEISNIEAAEVMEVSVDALESLLSRGRRKLKELLQMDREELLVSNAQGRATGFDG
ncbi:RNA polymerase sigma factor [Hirschia baltica]|uniref:RNA polymerase sigma factor n=1 Tax=Hirschia baltica (strain ATCC 49814 / DSM 5838 / IFAM 1418) TaxID=582402 RepID=C6XIM9_HIRBI|nr:RNA polymerase sigma factor [Hirschia baltica]ACT58974.1 RNA polymerase, sigma-24 subunit, ECF subfamily [Hirschia baltica ATCC 49814]